MAPAAGPVGASTAGRYTLLEQTAITHREGTSLLRVLVPTMTPAEPRLGRSRPELTPGPTVGARSAPSWRA